MTIYRLPINPIPCPRPKIAVRGKFANAYYPKAYQDWKTECAKLLLSHDKPAQYTLVRLSCHFEVEQPKSTKLLVPRGDLDNYCKSLMDALTQADWWGDDNQVVHITASKQWAAKGEPGRIRFTITEEVS